MTKYPIVSIAMTAIADLITARRIASGGCYEVVWLEDHFECRRITELTDGADRIIKLRCVDINEGLATDKWDIIRSAVHSLIEKGVVK